MAVKAVHVFIKGEACNLHDNCETCPFEECMLGKRVYIRDTIPAFKVKRNDEIRAMVGQGYSIQDVASRLELSIRTIQRVMGDAK